MECLAACLRVFADVDDLDTVREYLHHPSWQVRVQAVNVLGRLGAAARLRLHSCRCCPIRNGGCAIAPPRRCARFQASICRESSASATSTTTRSPGTCWYTCSPRQAHEVRRFVRVRSSAGRRSPICSVSNLVYLALNVVSFVVLRRHQAAADARPTLDQVLEPRAAGDAWSSRRTTRKPRLPPPCARCCSSTTRTSRSWSSTTVRPTGRSTCMKQSFGLQTVPGGRPAAPGDGAAPRCLPLRHVPGAESHR